MRGGARKGAGRKPGGSNVKAVEQVAKAAVEAKAVGLRLPHELLAEWANTGLMHCAAGPTLLNQQQMIACAHAAGPYYAPRLISHEVAGKGGGAIQFSGNVQVNYYVPENGRRVAPGAPANDAVAAAPPIALRSNGGNGSGRHT